MEKTLQKGNDKIQQICEKLRLETLEPARAEAQTIIEEAENRAKMMILEARKEIESLHKAARQEIEQERNVFESSLDQAAKLALEKLRQSIENKLLREDLMSEVTEKSSSKDVVAKLINALVMAIEKEGINSDLQAIIPKTISVDELTQYLTEKTLSKLKKEQIILGDLNGGVELKLKNMRMTLDISDKTLQSLLIEYIGSAFRERLFVDV